MEDETVDRLSDLPSHIIDQILSSIPTEETVRTSVLSKQWRNAWKSTSSLSFGGDIYHGSQIDYDGILQILEQHCGRIRKFDWSSIISTDNFINLITLLRDHQIEDLMIKVDVCDPWSKRNSDSLTLPPPPPGFKCLRTLKLSINEESLQSLFSGIHTLETLILDLQDNNRDRRRSADSTVLSSACPSWKTLTHLDIANCHLSALPSTFCGFKFLKTLKLNCVTASEETLQSLISGIHTLESLILESSYYSSREDSGSTSYTVLLSACLPWGTLTCLDISSCHLSALPSTFHGFKCLKTLKLYRVTASEETLQSLISGIHTLESLILESKDQDSTSYTVLLSACPSWRTLTRLDITNCHLSALPSTFRGFKCLKTLKLSYVTLSRETVQSLISGSSVLETLNIEFYHVDFPGFDVNAPTLKSFHFSCCNFVGVGLINCPALKEFHLCPMFDYEQDLCMEDLDKFIGYNIARLLAGSPRLQNLTITSNSFEYLVSGIIPKELRLEDLRSLTVHTDFWSTKEVTALNLLLSSSPNLEKISIKFRCKRNFDLEQEAKIWSNDQQWEAEQWDLAFPHLKYIVVKGFFGSPKEIRFVEQILLASPIMYNMHLMVSMSYKSRLCTICTSW